MKVYELIKLLEKMPQLTVVKMDNGEYLDDVEEVEQDTDREYIIIRPR